MLPGKLGKNEAVSAKSSIVVKKRIEGGLLLFLMAVGQEQSH